MVCKHARLITFSLVILFLLILTGAALANTMEQPVTPPTEGVPAGSTVGLTVENDIGINSFQYLADAGCSIEPGSAEAVILKGYTISYSAVDYVGLRLYLQKWDGSSWVDQSSWLFDQPNSNRVDGYKTVYVQGGAYYRSRAYHYVKEGSVTEPKDTVSQYIYVP